jgi:hypothetical protein
MTSDNKCSGNKKGSTGLVSYELHDRSTHDYTHVSSFMNNKNVFNKTKDDNESRSLIKRVGEPLPEMTGVCESTTRRAFFYPQRPIDLFKIDEVHESPNICSESFRPPSIPCFSAWGDIKTQVPDNLLGDTRDEDTFFCNTSGDRFHNGRQKLPLYTKQPRVSAYDQLLDQFSCKQ